MLMALKGQLEEKHVELKPCFELPAKAKENGWERPRLIDECTVLGIGTYLPS